MRRSRLCGSVSARKARAASAEGSAPITSSEARRRNSASLHAPEGRLAFGLVKHAAANPVEQRVVGGRVFGEAFAAFVRNGIGRLEQEEALFGRGWEDAPAAGVLHNLVEIGLRVIRKDGEL